MANGASKPRECRDLRETCGRHTSDSRVTEKLRGSPLAHFASAGELVGLKCAGEPDAVVRAAFAREADGR